VNADIHRDAALPTVQFGGEQYVVDTRLQQFRHIDKPWLVLAFDSMEGEAMMAATGIFICPHCGTVHRSRSGQRPKHTRCLNCRHPVRCD